MSDESLATKHRSALESAPPFPAAPDEWPEGVWERTQIAKVAIEDLERVEQVARNLMDVIGWDGYSDCPACGAYQLDGLGEYHEDGCRLAQAREVLGDE